MNITPQQISTLMEHKKRFKEAVDKLSGIIDGTGAPITAIIKGNDDGAVEEAERFAEDVLQAYDLYPEAFYSFMYDISFDDYFEMFFWNYEKDKGSPSRLDASQRTLVKSMLCCLALLGAHGPGLSPTGSFANLKENCRALLAVFQRDGAHRGTWQRAILDYAFSQGKPSVTSTRYLAATIFNSPDMTFPTLAEESISFRNEIVVGNLLAVYEALSGKPFVSIISDEERNAYMAKPEYFADLKDPMRIAALTQDEVDIALEHGWLTEHDIRDHGPFATAEPLDAEDGLWLVSNGIDPDDLDRETERVGKWVEDFPWKEPWCEHYRRMYHALFQLDGTDPHSNFFDTDTWTEASPLSIEQLLESIDAVLDARGVSHYDDDVFRASYESIRRASAHAYRALNRKD